MPRFIVYQGHQWSVEEFRRYVGDPGPHLRGFFVTGATQTGKESEALESAHISPDVLYLLAHKNDRIVKIGITRKSTANRLKDYIRRHRLSGSWRVYKEWSISDAAKVERKIADALRVYRISKRSREIFVCSPEEALETIHNIIQLYAHASEPL